MRRLSFGFLFAVFFVGFVLPQTSNVVVHTPESTLEVAASTPFPTISQAEMDAMILTATQSALNAAGITNYNPPPTRDPDDYRIVYLFAPGTVAPDSLYAPESLAAYMPLEVVTTWEEVLALDVEQPIDTLIVHGSAKDMVDVEWMRDAPFRGLMLATINLDFVEIAELLGNQCRKAKLKIGTFPTVTDGYWVVKVDRIRLTNPADEPVYFDAKYVNCTKFKPTGEMNTSSSGGQGNLSELNGVQRFANYIRFRLER